MEKSRKIRSGLHFSGNNRIQYQCGQFVRGNHHGGITLGLWIAITLIGLIALGLTAAYFAWFRRSVQRARLAPLGRAKQQFHVQRERLEAKFIQLAAAHTGHDAPQLTDCTFDDDVAYLRCRRTGELSAFVAVTIATESVATGYASGVNVENLQAGTAVFRFDCDHWETDGRTLLNLTPDEAAVRFDGDLEVVDQEIASHRY
jgi:hypothetical protein